ncbi:MAG: hypothetical protein ABSA12_00605 [Verrucomicrobiia bacterium]
MFMLRRANALGEYLYSRLCCCLFWICVAASGVVGLFGARSSPFPQVLFAAPLISVVGFLVSYRVVALSLVRVFERKKGIEFEKPSITRGIMYSAVSPIVIALAMVLLFIVSQFISPMHDSM